MRNLNRLTAVKVAKVKKPGRYADGGNLFLSVRNGGRSWIFKYADRATGRERELGLGPIHAVTLTQARESAARQRAFLADGRDPFTERHAARAALVAQRAKNVTLGAALPGFLKTRTAGLRNPKHVAQWGTTLTTYAKPLHTKLIRDIESADVLAVLAPIWTVKHETATRLRMRLENFFDYAKMRNWRTGDNPAAYVGNLKSVLRKPDDVGRHHAALPFADVPQFMLELRGRDSVSARALELAILCAARTGEVRGATWGEVDLKNRVWTIPAARMKIRWKNRKHHRVPLSPRVIAILESMPQGESDDYIFPGARRGQPLSDMALLECLRDLRDDVTVHGFRAAFSTWRGEATSFPKEVAEFALAHIIGDAAEAAYQRSDLFERRRELMSAWDGYCAGERADVVKLERRK